MNTPNTKITSLQELQRKHTITRYFQEKSINLETFEEKYMLTPEQGYNFILAFIERYQQCNPKAHVNIYTTLNTKEINYLLLVAGKRGYNQAMKFVSETNCALETIVWFIAKLGNIKPRY